MCDSKVNQGESQDHSLIVRVVSSVLDKLICGHVDSPRHSTSNGFVKFQSSYAPDVSIESYLERIRRYSRCSDACFVMTLVYVDRLIETKNLILTPLNVHRLLITSVMLAAKFHDDLFYNNAYYSKLGGLSLVELNLLESDLLHHLDFSLFVKETAYGKYSMQLQNYVFFLEVQPALPSSMSATAHCAYAYPAVPIQEQRHGAGFTYTAHVQAMGCPPPATVAAISYAQQQSFDLHGTAQMVNVSCPPTGAYYTYDGRRIPSPDNAHAKACSFSEQYLTANSPFHMAPARPMSGSFSVPNTVTPLSLQAAQIQAALLVQHDLEKQYCSAAVGTSYSAAEMDTEMQLQGMNPMDYTTTGGGGQDLCRNMTSRSTSSNFASMYGGGADAASSLFDSYEDAAGTTTSCSTRTCSPYPGIYTRSYSGNNVNMGTGPYSTGQNISVHSGNHMISTPSMYSNNASGNMGMYPPQQIGWSGTETDHRRRSGSLSIYTDPCTLDMESAYPFQRSESGSCGSTYDPSLQLQVPLRHQVSFPRTVAGGVPPMGVYSTNDASAEYTSPLYPRNNVTNTGGYRSPPHSASAGAYGTQQMQVPPCGGASGDYMRGDFWPQGGRTSVGKVVTPPPSYYHQHLQPLYASGVGVNTAGTVPSYGLLRQMSEEELVSYQPSQCVYPRSAPTGMMLRAGVM